MVTNLAVTLGTITDERKECGGNEWTTNLSLANENRDKGNFRTTRKYEILTNELTAAQHGQ